MTVLFLVGLALTAVGLLWVTRHPRLPPTARRAGSPPSVPTAAGPEPTPATTSPAFEAGTWTLPPVPLDLSGLVPAAEGGHPVGQPPPAGPGAPTEAERAAFLCFAADVVEADTGVRPEIDVAGFQLQVAGRCVLSLATTYWRCRDRQDADRREAVLDAVRAALTPVALDTWEDVRPLLVPRVANKARMAAAACQLGWHPLDGPPPFVELDERLALDVVARTPERQSWVAHLLPEWGVGLAEALREAIQVVDQRRLIARGDASAGQLSMTPTRYRSQRLCLVDFDRANHALALVVAPDLTHTGTPIAMLASDRDGLFVAPCDDAEAMEDLLGIAESEIHNPRHVSLLPYVRVPSGQGPSPLFPWVPWDGAAHPVVRPRLRRLGAVQRLRDDAELHGNLVAAEVRRGGSPERVRPLRQVDADVPGGLATVTTWPPYAAWLPVSDLLDVTLPGQTVVWRVRREDVRDLVTPEPVVGLVGLYEAFPPASPRLAARLVERGVRAGLLPAPLREPEAPLGGLEA